MEQTPKVEIEPTNDDEELDKYPTDTPTTLLPTMDKLTIPSQDDDFDDEDDTEDR